MLLPSRCDPEGEIGGYLHFFVLLVKGVNTGKILSTAK